MSRPASSASRLMRMWSRGAIPDLVGYARVPDLRNDRRGDVLEALEAVERILGLDRDGANRRVVLFQAPRVADERARGAQPGDEVSDASRGLREDLHRRAL